MTTMNSIRYHFSFRATSIMRKFYEFFSEDWTNLVDLRDGEGAKRNE